ncbi:hypothetical protein B5807_05228 [Epicoccum nigrum]|uniref:Uncharacterized protein n=1 Tax=Epicoccum nigrum TaxID=105696 RepID=A0A1Y2M1U2_EPING|nr:hypothetical protein B5807_05228 [Epicoccum nigrum]
MAIVHLNWTSLDLEKRKSSKFALTPIFQSSSKPPAANNNPTKPFHTRLQSTIQYISYLTIITVSYFFLPLHFPSIHSIAPTNPFFAFILRDPFSQSISAIDFILSAGTRESNVD